MRSPRSLHRYEKEIYFPLISKSADPTTHFVAFHDRVAIVTNVA